jgi:outer membrane immunogenic protein
MIAKHLALLALVAAAGVPKLALAADLPVKGPSLPAPNYLRAPPPVFGWTGFYIGGNAGAALPFSNVSDTLFVQNFDTGKNNASFIGGGQIGLNVQLSEVVVGIEGDFDGVANNHSAGTGIAIPAVGTIQVSSSERWISTAAARFGVTFDHWLLYAKAGAGWVGNDNFTISNVTAGLAVTSPSNTTTGWLGGAGFEWAFAQNWSVKVEYDYLGLFNRTIFIPVASPVLPGDTFITGNRNIQMVKVGVNYLFNWWQPVAISF